MEERDYQLNDMSSECCTAFHGSKCVTSGTRAEVASFLREQRLPEHQGAVLIFDNASGDQIELDLRDSTSKPLERAVDICEKSELESSIGAPSQGPGRPKLGVIAREVTLLPRHWEWLNRRPGGASVALRKLVEEARRTHAEQDRRRQSQSAAYKFITAVAGDRPGYEEAVRALFAGKRVRFELEIERWPADIRGHALKLASASFGEQ